MDFNRLVNQLKEVINDPLPGDIAHRIVAPSRRLTLNEYLKQNPSYKTSSVMMLICNINSSPHLLLIERSGEGDTHSGQVGFPGGKRELDDKSILETALRETYEEIGIAPSSIKVIGQLSDLFIPVSGFLVHPFVGYIESTPAVTLNAKEVSNLFYADFYKLMLQQPLSGLFDTKTFGVVEAGYFAVDHYKVWGATAMMISELIYILKK